jgi:hypothetical protein
VFWKKPLTEARQQVCLSLVRSDQAADPKPALPTEMPPNLPEGVGSPYVVEKLVHKCCNAAWSNRLRPIEAIRTWSLNLGKAFRIQAFLRD